MCICIYIYIYIYVLFIFICRHPPEVPRGAHEGGRAAEGPPMKYYYRCLYSYYYY